MFRVFKCFFASAILMSLFSLTYIWADEVTIINNDRITGKVVAMEGNLLKIETSYAGLLEIKWSEIKGLKTDTEITVLLSDDTSLKGIPVYAQAGTMMLSTEKLDQKISFVLADIKAINPAPVSDEPALKTTGRINLGLTSSSGNTETESRHFDGEFIARTRKNRYTAGGELNRKEDEGKRTEDNTLAYLKYDHFFSERWFVYSNAIFEKDRFKDIKLRTALGLGGGYQFFEGDYKNLSLEAGFTYINEDNDSAADDNYPSGRWSLNYDRFIIEKRIQFFHFHEGFLSLDDMDDIFIRSRTGIRVPVYKNFNATLQYNYDWDKSPSFGREKSDRGYQLSVGYLFGKE